MYAIDDLEAFPRSVLILENRPISSEFPVGPEDMVGVNKQLSVSYIFSHSNRGIIYIHKIISKYFSWRIYTFLYESDSCFVFLF